MFRCWSLQSSCGLMERIDGWTDIVGHDKTKKLTVCYVYMYVAIIGVVQQLRHPTV